MVKIENEIVQTTINVCSELDKCSVDYRLTGVAAANFYGHGLGTNVIDIAVESDEAVYEAVRVLGLPEQTEFDSYDPYVYFTEEQGGYIRIQGDLLGEPVMHPLGFKLHSKELLLDRLDIYANGATGGRIEISTAFIALTKDAEKTEKYKYIWNRL